MPSDAKAGAGWNFDNTYAHLPDVFYTPQHPTPVRAPRMAIFNRALAETLGLNPDMLEGPEGVSVFAGNALPDGATPIAQAYAGHQFGRFTMLGDGRAILLGEQRTPDGSRFDIQLKGPGQTAYSRRGDGRAALGPMLREYIISEAMHGLGIPTTRSLAVVSTGEPVYREEVLPGAVLTRVAASHIRVGTFEYAARIGPEAVQALADYTIARHYPELAQSENRYLLLIQTVMARQASLVSKWQHVGFIHGVMNTDNMAISGEAIDYGPCAFMDAYDPATVFSSIDAQGRYAYGNQPLMAQWDLARWVEALLPLLHPEPEKAMALGQEAIEAFPALYQGYWLSGMRAKLGLFHAEPEDEALIQSLLTLMHQAQADYTNTFRALSSESLPDAPVFQTPEFKAWHPQWQARLTRQPEGMEAAHQLMNTHNPAVIPRNHRVEEALASAVQGDMSVMEKLLDVLRDPYGDVPNEYCLLPEAENAQYRTFCGT